MALTSPFSPFLSVTIKSRVARTCGKVSASRAIQNFQLPLLASASGQTSPTHQSKWRLANSGSRGRAVPLRQFIALSAASALAFYFRRQGSKQYRLRQFMASASSEEMRSKAKRIDSHLHVWASPEEAKQFPYALDQQPTLPGSSTYLVESMLEAGVDGALIIQPIDHRFDHSYVSSVLQKYPGKFVGCCLADPTDGGGGVRELERLISKEDENAKAPVLDLLLNIRVSSEPCIMKIFIRVPLFMKCVQHAPLTPCNWVHQEGYRAVRFNPYLWPSGQQMTNEVGRAMFSKAGELGAVVGFMCFKGLLLHIEDIEELCLEFPSTTVMIDHFGFCKPAKSDEEAKAWKRLLGLAQFPQVYVKVSAFFRISREPFPYKDTWPLVQELLTVFGAKRLLWGSDFPFVAAQCGYVKANKYLPQLIAETLSISGSEVEYLLGGTACQLFEGAWQESLLVS